MSLAPNWPRTLSTLNPLSLGVATMATLALVAGGSPPAYSDAPSPGYILGRVASFDIMVSFSLSPLSSAVTGPLAGVVGVRRLLIVAGGVTTITTLAFLLLPGPGGADPPPAERQCEGAALALSLERRPGRAGLSWLQPRWRRCARIPGARVPARPRGEGSLSASRYRRLPVGPAG